MEESNVIHWSPAEMLEVTLNEPDDFLKVRETLTRIGVASRKDKKLFQFSLKYFSSARQLALEWLIFLFGLHF